MKRIFLFLILSISVVSCKKDDEKVDPNKATGFTGFYNLAYGYQTIHKPETVKNNYKIISQLKVMYKYGETRSFGQGGIGNAASDNFINFTNYPIIVAKNYYFNNNSSFEVTHTGSDYEKNGFTINPQDKKCFFTQKTDSTITLEVWNGIGVTKSEGYRFKLKKI